MRATYGTLPSAGGVLNSTYIGFDFDSMLPATYEQESQPIHIGPGVQRSAQRGLFKVKIASFAGGLNPAPNVQDLGVALDTYSFNPGWQTRVPGAMVLPWKLNTLGSLTSDEDISGAVAANWRVHDCISSLNTAGEVLYSCLGHKMFGPTSLSDATPVVVATFTDVVTCVNELVVNGARVFAVATNGTTDDTKYTATPDAPSWTTLFSHTTGDYITAIAYLATVGPGVNIVIGKVGGVNGVWWFPTDEAAPVTLQPCVTTVSKDQLNPNNPIQNTGAVFAREVFAVAALGSQDDITITNSSNIGANDGAEVQVASTASANFTDQVQAVGFLFDFSAALPSGGWEPSGYVLVYERREGNADDNIALQSLALVSGITPSSATFVSAPRFEGNGVEWSTSVEAITVPASGTTDRWGSQLTPAQIRAGDFGVGGNFFATAPWNMFFDYATMTVYYRATGQTVAFPIGGNHLNRNPVFPNRISIRTPHEDDTAAITKPRELWHIDFDWQADQERPTFSYSQPNEGARYVWSATPHQGGYLLGVGYSSADRGILVKHSDASGGLRDYRFFGTHDDYIAKVNDVYTWGSWALLDVYYVNSAGTVLDRQFVWLSPGVVYYTDFLMQSYSNHVIAAQPIPHATCYIDPTHKVVRTWYPNGTDTATAWTFVPPDPELDPRVNYTTETKTMRWTGTSGSRTEDTALEIRGSKDDVGHEEANKTVLEVRYQGNRISAAGGTDGSVTFELEDDGNDFSTPVFSNEFTAAYSSAATRFEYDYLQWQIKGTHEAGTAKTPDALSWLLTTYQQWEAERQYTFFLTETFDSLWNFLNGVEAVQRLGVQRLYFDEAFPGTSARPALVAALESFGWPQQRPLTADELMSNQVPPGTFLTFVSKPGAAT